jgi:hypothetical protein
MTYINPREQAKQDAEYMKGARKRSYRRYFQESQNMPEAPKTLPMRTITESQYQAINDAISAATRGLPYWQKDKLAKSIFFDMLAEFVQMRDIDPHGAHTTAIVVSEPSDVFTDGYYAKVFLKGGISIDVYTKQPILNYYEGKYLLDKPVKDFVIVIPDQDKPALTDAEVLLQELLSAVQK